MFPNTNTKRPVNRRPRIRRVAGGGLGRGAQAWSTGKPFRVVEYPHRPRKKTPAATPSAFGHHGHVPIKGGRGVQRVGGGRFTNVFAGIPR